MELPSTRYQAPERLSADAAISTRLADMTLYKSFPNALGFYKLLNSLCFSLRLQ